MQDNRVGDAMRKRISLAGTRSGNHQQWRKWARSNCTMFDGASLFRIEVFEIGSVSRHVGIAPFARSTVTDSRFVRNGAGREPGSLVGSDTVADQSWRALNSATALSHNI
jgi:hypothetical protein